MIIFVPRNEPTQRQCDCDAVVMPQRMPNNAEETVGLGTTPPTRETVVCVHVCLKVMLRCPRATCSTVKFLFVTVSLQTPLTSSASGRANTLAAVLPLRHPWGTMAGLVRPGNL